MLDAQGNPVAAGPLPDGQGNPAPAGPESAGAQTTPAAGAVTPSGDYQSLQTRVHELETLNARYRANMDGSRQEAERARTELAALRAQAEEFDQWRQRAATVFSGSAAPGSDPTQPMTLAQATDAYYSWRADSGQPNPLVVYEQQREERLLQQAEQRTLGKVYQSVAPAQRFQAVMERHKETLDFGTGAGAEVMAIYDQLSRDPLERSQFPDDPTWQIQLHPDTKQLDPQTGQPRVVDIRLLDKAALQYRATHGAPVASPALQPVEGQRSGGTAAANPAEPDGPLIYDDEIIHDPDVQERLRQAGRGQDKRTLIKWYWEHMAPRERDKRIALQNAGRWDGRRVS